jgi:hypothetical protein
MEEHILELKGIYKVHYHVMIQDEKDNNVSVAHFEKFNCAADFCENLTGYRWILTTLYDSDGYFNWQSITHEYIEDGKCAPLIVNSKLIGAILKLRII